MSKADILVKSSVVFDELSHTYNYMGCRLSGITSLLHRTLFADKYTGISPDTDITSMNRLRL